MEFCQSEKVGTLKVGVGILEKWKPPHASKLIENTWARVICFFEILPQMSMISQRVC